MWEGNKEVRVEADLHWNGRPMLRHDMLGSARSTALSICQNIITVLTFCIGLYIDNSFIRLGSLRTEVPAKEALQSRLCTTENFSFASHTLYGPPERVRPLRRSCYFAPHASRTHPVRRRVLNF